MPIEDQGQLFDKITNYVNNLAPTDTKPKQLYISYNGHNYSVIDQKQAKNAKGDMSTTVAKIPTSIVKTYIKEKTEEIQSKGYEELTKTELTSLNNLQMKEMDILSKSKFTTDKDKENVNRIKDLKLLTNLSIIKKNTPIISRIQAKIAPIFSHKKRASKSLDIINIKLEADSTYKNLKQVAFKRCKTKSTTKNDLSKKDLEESIRRYQREASYMPHRMRENKINIISDQAAYKELEASSKDLKNISNAIFKLKEENPKGSKKLVKLIRNADENQMVRLNKDQSKLLLDLVKIAKDNPQFCSLCNFNQKQVQKAYSALKTEYNSKFSENKNNLEEEPLEFIQNPAYEGLDFKENKLYVSKVEEEALNYSNDTESLMSKDDIASLFAEDVLIPTSSFLTFIADIID